MGRYLRRVGAWVCACAAVLALPAPAAAFELRHTSSGLPVRWVQPNVEFVIDPSVLAAGAGADQAVANAASVWSGVGGTPVLSTSVSKAAKATKPAVDGTNTIIFAPDGYAPAHGALAITLLSFDDKTGAIVDADIVINGAHAFAILAAASRAKSDAVAVSNEATSQEDDERHGRSDQFDLQHVIAHEMGHALGLGDVRDDVSAVMYAYTKPNDASSRAPSSDDLAGVGELYPASGAISAPAGGCGASVAATRVTSHDEWAAAVLALGAGFWLASRRHGSVLVRAAQRHGRSTDRTGGR